MKKQSKLILDKNLYSSFKFECADCDKRYLKVDNKLTIVNEVRKFKYAKLAIFSVLVHLIS